MDIRKIGAITEIDGKVRIEAGPIRRQAVATAELLADATTAAHYKVGGRDALGKPIKLGAPMDYIDWRSSERAFYVYTRLDLKAGDTDPVTKKKSAVEFTRWMLAGDRPTEHEALSLGTQLAAAPAAKDE
jgi:hypothetical protein